MFKKALVVVFLTLVLISFAFASADEKSFTDDDYLLLSDVPITYGELGFRERILERTKGERDPIGLVLTGGSARALAHLGVLEYLEENSIVPDFIISNSMGSIIGLLYAAGLECQQISDLMMMSDLSNYFSLTLPTRGGMLDLTGFKSLISSVVGEELRLEDLPIPVMVICDDLVTKREIRICEGSFIDVLIASFALPVYFSPSVYNGHLLLDGGVKTLVPLDAAYEYTDTLIVSTTFYDLDSINLLNPITILNSAFDVGKRQRAASDMKKRSDFIWIRCAVEQFSFMDFSSALEMMRIGYESAKEQSDALSLLYKSGNDEFREIRSQIQENIENTRSNLFYFDRVEAISPTNLLTLGGENRQGDSTYLNEMELIGVQYRFLYDLVELDVTAGWAFNTHDSTFSYNGPAINVGLELYPLANLRIAIDNSVIWYDWVWTPFVNVSQSLDYVAYTDQSDLRVTPFERIEYNRASDGDYQVLFSLGSDLSYSVSFYDTKAELSYMLIKDSSRNVANYLNFAVKNRFNLPLSLFIDIGLTDRVRIDGQSGSYLYFRDGFENSTINPFFGEFYRNTYNIFVLNAAFGYKFNAYTIGEFLIFKDSRISAFFDMLLADAEFYYTTGVEIESNLSLIGLIDLPLRVRLGYSSANDGFIGSLLFCPSF